jgi:heptosyltransferase III
MLTTIKLHHNEPIAFICSPRLGDTLISLVVVNNLVRNGYSVEVYGDYAYALRAWFPWAKMHKVVAIEAAQETLCTYPLILHMYASELSKSLHNWHPNSIVLSESPLYRARIPQADIQAAICKEVLHLQDVVRANNIKLPPELNYRKHFGYVVIHPTSGESFRSWPASKFIRLAKILKVYGLRPKFIVAPDERDQWLKLLNNDMDLLPKFADLSEVAGFIYESGWFIGNDSGIGHLASNLGIPTLSLILRPNLARQWRPSWALGKVVLPPAWLITRPLKEKFWKHCVSVKRVLEEFYELVNSAN